MSTLHTGKRDLNFDFNFNFTPPAVWPLLTTHATPRTTQNNPDKLALCLNL